MKENSVFSCSPTHASALTRAEGWPALEPGCQNLKTTADFLHPGVHLANVSLQHPTSSWIVGLQAARAGSLHPGKHRAVGFATPARYAARAGLTTGHALTFQPDHSMGADQFSPLCSRKKYKR